MNDLNDYSMGIAVSFMLAELSGMMTSINGGLEETPGLLSDKFLDQLETFKEKVEGELNRIEEIAEAFASRVQLTPEDTGM